MRQRDNHISNVNICTSLGKLFLLMVKKIFLFYDHQENTTDEKKLLIALGQVLSLATSAKERMWFFWDFCVWMSQVLCIILALLYLKRTFPWPTYECSTAQPTIYFIYCCSRSKCFLAALWPFSVRQTEEVSCLTGLFPIVVSLAKVFTAIQLSQDTKGHSLHLSLRTALQLWCQGTITFLLLGIFSSP